MTKKKTPTKKTKANPPYQTDPDLREKVRARSLASYRERNGLTLDRSIDTRTVDTQGSVRTIIVGKKVRDEMTFSLDQAANVFGVSNVALATWIKSGRCPGPQLKVARSIFPVYSLAQAKAMAKVLANHFQNKQYMTRTDGDTTAKLFACM